MNNIARLEDLGDLEGKLQMQLLQQTLVNMIRLEILQNPLWKTQLHQFIIHEMVFFLIFLKGEKIPQFKSIIHYFLNLVHLQFLMEHYLMI